MAKFVTLMQSPADVMFLDLSASSSVEPNEVIDRDMLDRFNAPVFGPAEDLHNTHHGSLPGQGAAWKRTQGEYKDTHTLITADWIKS